MKTTHANPFQIVNSYALWGEYVDTLGLDTEHHDIVPLDVEGFPIERHWCFVYPVGRQLSIVAASFMDFVRREAGRLVLDHLDSAPPSR